MRQDVSRASVQKATGTLEANTATTLPEEGRGSRHPEAAVLLYTLLRSRGSG
jgi:hypothetical protein